MVLRVGHDRGFQQASLVPSPPPFSPTSICQAGTFGAAFPCTEQMAFIHHAQISPSPKEVCLCRDD